MKIQISGATYDALQEFNFHGTSFRGAIAIKGKGTMETYWLDGKDNKTNESVIKNHEQQKSTNSIWVS